MIEDTGINRNIMECKDKTGIPVQKLNLVLIETLWNVKLLKIIRCKGDGRVLIETLWNVKDNLVHFHLLIGSVLIETLWNVKLLSTSCS